VDILEAIVIIPALGKRGPFADTLTKNLAGVPLIKRAIIHALTITKQSRIYVVTDSDEVELICERSHISLLTISNWKSKYEEFSNHSSQTIIFISPFFPLLEMREIISAFNILQKNEQNVLVPVVRSRTQIQNSGEKLGRQQQFFNVAGEQTVLITSSCFRILSSDLLIDSAVLPKGESCYFELQTEPIEINRPQDWWVCEKLLKRKRIIFRVIGSEAIGMGHVYRSLSLAHEITDHEIIFVCDKESQIAVKKLAGSNYRYQIFNTDKIIEEIIGLNPDMVINDILNTNREDIIKLQQQEIKVINFEDFGDGAVCADLTINEMFDSPTMEGENILWGRQYYFIRDEFYGAKTHVFENHVNALLITFGGTDQHDLTRKILFGILPYCERSSIKIFVVTGSGYMYLNELKEEVSKLLDSNIEVTHATGVMSRIMEKTSIAITSNGRTVYELAHMSIPAIVIPVNEREKTHEFACEKNGFISLNGFRDKETPNEVLNALKKLVENTTYRKTLHQNTVPFNFTYNKKNILKRIEKLLQKEKKVY
jgi:spore coat polysaccharide biosynthesis predicted glycosyltransferase SpsG/CMP-N-acetylneuraminic acid synthetase